MGGIVLLCNWVCHSNSIIGFLKKLLRRYSFFLFFPPHSWIPPRGSNLGTSFSSLQLVLVFSSLNSLFALNTCIVCPMIPSPAHIKGSPVSSRIAGRLYLLRGIRICSGARCHRSLIKQSRDSHLSLTRVSEEQCCLKKKVYSQTDISSCLWEIKADYVASPQSCIFSVSQWRDYSKEVAGIG